jgi:hypothetical protein
MKTIWTTFCPGKICWELTYAQTKGKAPTSDWLKHAKLIEQSLHTLKNVGIAGIRLVIFPSEVTNDGKKFDWTAIDTILKLCIQRKIEVILCIGPFQYPNYPGIYLPPGILREVFVSDNALDTNPLIKRFGIHFLKLQLERYGKSKDILGFHFANEWPDRQAISGKEKIRQVISEDFMTTVASLLAVGTDKPIFLNTNIDASDKKKITNTFTNILTILKEQVLLGFDIYPSQETWRKVPLQKLKRLFEPYYRSFNRIKNCKTYFAEVEAQPWGDGRSWFQIIQSENKPQKSILSYSRSSLLHTKKKYLSRTHCNMVSLWGADFWLTAKALGVSWPLEKIKTIFPSAV